MFALEKVEPTTHAAQVRSVLASGALDWPWPTGHSKRAVQLFLPAKSWNVSPVQFEHCVRWLPALI